jgi:hypothetical protein
VQNMRTRNHLNGRGVRKGPKSWMRRHWWVPAVLAVVLCGAGLVGWKAWATPAPPTDPPEAERVLRAQQDTGNFGILIPGYLPKGFDRSNVDVRVDQNGPAGEPAVDMVYRRGASDTVFIHQWVPVNPTMETLSGSRVIETKWGKSWLLTEGTDGLIAVWVDVGPLRVSISCPSQTTMTREQLVLAANTLGLVSDLQVYSFVTALPVIKDMAPPPPYEVRVNEDGVQELNLTITPGGYAPMRFSVKKDVPVKLNFRALGQVGCGSTLIFPTQADTFSALSVGKDKMVDSVEFTPGAAGDFAFHCASNHYRGVMSVTN